MSTKNKHRAAMKRRILLVFASFAQITLVFLACADPLPVTEKQRIEALISHVAESKDVKFVRNGTTYSADSAARFLRLKWQANESEVKTARDFIDKVASMSGTSGKPYFIRFSDGSEMKSKDFLLAELRKLEH
jgi:hypothetical protein